MSKKFRRIELHDIGPSGDHQYQVRASPGYHSYSKIDMDSWLKKEQGSDSSNGSYKNEMYNVNENHIDKINTIRRQLKLLEILDDDEEPKTNTLDFDNISADSSESISYNPEKLNKSQRKRKYNSFKMTSENALGKDANIFSKTTESLQISLPTSNYSTLEYNTPKRKKLKVKRTPHFYKQLLGTQSTIDISPSNLENDKESVLGSTQIRYINRNFRRKNVIDDQCDNRNMEKPEDVHLEPNVKIMQGTSNENCLKFLPIKDRKIVFTEKPESRIFKDNLFNIDITFDEIAPPTIPICNNFFELTESIEREKNVEPHAPNLNQQCKTNYYEVIDYIQENTFEKEQVVELPINLLTTSLSVPLKKPNVFKFPAITKLSQFIQEVKEKGTSNIFDDETFSIKQNATPRKITSKLSNRYVGVSNQYSEYKEAAEKLLRTNFMNIIDCDTDETEGNIGKSWSNENCSNKYNCRKHQSVDYNFYSADLSTRRSNDVINRNQVLTDDSDSDCFSVIESCCCIRKIFKKKRRR